MSNKKLHFVLIPLMAQGHMLPMVDMAKLFAERGVTVTIITTPENATRFSSIIDRASTEDGFPVRVVVIPFRGVEFGIHIGCENLDALSSRDLLPSFYKAVDELREPVKEFLDQTEPKASCVISDKYLTWTSSLAKEFDIPRIVFHGMSCFSLLSSYNIKLFGSHLSVGSDSEPFFVPNMPNGIEFEVTKSQLPGSFFSLPDFDDIRNKMKETESSDYGVVVNSFDELENGCVEGYEKVIRKKVWCIGPVNLCNKKQMDQLERGNHNNNNNNNSLKSNQGNQCIEFLNSNEKKSVIYACLGSLCRLVPTQVIQLGLALESSGHPFIWVVKTGDHERYNNELNKWLVESRFEERIEKRGIVIKGWAPQLMILSHSSIGGFVTHCGWNSTIEGVCSGVPMVTWPLFAEQFLNERFIVRVMKIGVRVGVEVPVRWGEEEKVGVLVKKEDVEKCIDEIMNGGEEGENRRRRAIEIKVMAIKAMEEGKGSSWLNMSLLIQDILDRF